MFLDAGQVKKLKQAMAANQACTLPGLSSSTTSTGGTGTILGRGVVNLGAGVSSGSVAGLGLSAIPVCVQLTVQSDGNQLIFACLSSTPTAAGFSYLLSGITESANLKLHYTCIG